RFGNFIVGGARVNGQSIVPDGWLAQATSSRADTGQPGRGYGYQWWTYDDGTFAARGIFGQGLFIDRERKLVIGTNANWAGGARQAGDIRGRGRPQPDPGPVTTLHRADPRRDSRSWCGPSARC